MRRSKAEKQLTHERIVKAAARQFRAEGIHEVGIAELMGKIGLTHGGFYAHFSSKDALTAEVCTEGFAQTEEKLQKIVEQASPGGELAAIIDYYLRPDHRDQPESGCIMPSLAADIARHPEEVQKAFTEGYLACLERIAPFCPGATSEEQQTEAMILFSGMVGALMLARAVNDPETSSQLLQTSQAFYKKALTE